MFDLIMFDLDGTLTDPKEGITNCVKYALKAFGIEENNEAILLRFIGPPLTDSFKEVYGFSDEQALFALNKYRERFSDVGIYENSLLDGAEELLSALKRNGKVVALATSKPYVYAKRIIEKFRIDRYFDYAVGAELDGTRSYKNEVITEVLRQASVTDLSRAVMIGDRRQDIIGAKKCGISSMGVRCGYAEKCELEDAGADYIFENLGEIKDFLTK